MNKIILLTTCVLVAVGAVLFLQVDNKPASVPAVADEPASLTDSAAAQRPLVDRPFSEADEANEAEADSAGQPPATTAADSADDDDTAPDQSTYAELSAWSVADETPIDVDGVEGLAIQTDPAALRSMKVGQKISLPIPDLQPMPEATIESTHSPLDGIDVFKGALNDGQANDNVIVTRGEIDTIFVVSTSTGVYTAIVNNRTGQGSLVNEADVNARAVPIADGIEVAPVEMPLPERGQGS
ncbi:MAG: hypothetical protein CME36_19085 [unclassified Hahellaceae]|nr:hypothetical protein [Hahellaceae bacterium]|tara:strand:+ start:16599 stop:17321 length:723 start_codon:yes stop_codon:yes gene_type:complete